MTSESQNAYRYRRIVQAKRFIDEHYSKPIDLKEISSEACFSRFHFLRLFKSAYGKTPWNYLSQLRIYKAAELLEEENYTVTEICFKVGFSSIGSFSSLFKKNKGLSPSEYREFKRQKKITVSRQPLQYVPNCFAVHYGWS